MSGTAPNNDILSWGRVQRLLAGALRLGEALPGILRSDSYGEVINETLTSKQHKLSDEGSYYLTRSPTVGTGILQTVSTAFSDTQPYILIVNNNPVPVSGAGRNIYLDYIKLNVTNAGVTHTSLQYATRLDAVANRYTSGGSGGYGTNLTSVLSGPYPTNQSSPMTSSALIYAGVLVVGAGSSQARTISNGFLRTVIDVVNDSYFFNFASTDSPFDTVSIATAAVIQRNIPHPPVVIPPQCCFLLHLFATAMGTGPQYEVEIGHVER